MAFTKVETAGINSTGSLNLNGPVLIGSGTSTGTASQTLQVTGGAYVSGNLGIGTTNLTHKLHVVGDARITGILTVGTGSITINGPTDTISGVTTINTASINDGQLAGLRNKIINGAMEISQRGTSFAAAASGTYTLDRFAWYKSGAMVVTITQSTDVPNDTFQNSLKVDVTTADTSIAAGDFAIISPRIEGYNARDLIGQTFTLSFWVKSPKTGTHCIGFSNSGLNRSYILEYTVSTANTWEYKSVTVTGGLITAGTWNWTNGSGLNVIFSLAAGSAFQTTAGAWQTGDFQATSNQVNCMDSTANDFFLTGVQLEIGPVATPFERRPIGTELSLCQRYFYSTTTNGSNHISVNQKTTTSGNYGGAFPVQNRFPVQMRTAPNVTTYTNSTRSNPGNVLVNGATASTGFSHGADTIAHATWNNGALTNVGDYYTYHMDATAEL